METKLYLCSFTVEKTGYFNDASEETGVRLVRAHSYDEAEMKLRQAVEREDPYGVSVRIVRFEINEEIQ